MPKGPKHGGANIKVVQMFEDMKQNVRDWTDEEAVEAYLRALLHREAFDRAGLIYGMGHAVYSLSDPRANVFKHFVEMLSEEKGRHEEYALYAAVARLAPKLIGEERKIYKGVSANIDFYSGFVYSMLDLPLELYTPIFAISRIAAVAPTASRSSSMRARSSVLHTRVSNRGWTMCLCTTANNLQNKTGAWKAPGLALLCVECFRYNLKNMPCPWESAVPAAP